jgi:hypothetical protein
MTNETNAEVIAWEFVQQFYSTFEKNPEALFAFYGEDSQWTMGFTGQIAENIRGIDVHFSFLLLGNQKTI